jgi:hypothetical protein
MTNSGVYGGAASQVGVVCRWGSHDLAYSMMTDGALISIYVEKDLTIVSWKLCSDNVMTSCNSVAVSYADWEFAPVDFLPTRIPAIRSSLDAPFQNIFADGSRTHSLPTAK